MQSKMTAGFPARQNSESARQAPRHNAYYRTFVGIQAPVGGEDVDWTVVPVIYMCLMFANWRCRGKFKGFFCPIGRWRKFFRPCYVNEDLETLREWDLIEESRAQ